MDANQINSSVSPLASSAKASTGSKSLDYYLSGGYESGIITTIFGPSGSGKTNLVLLAAVRMAETGKKIVIIDTEGGIAVERIVQLLDNQFAKEDILSRILFFQPLNF